MGHRAIVAYERTDGSYSLHYSHRGAHRFRLRETLDESHPFGVESNAAWATAVIQQIRTGEDITEELTREQTRSVEVDPMPRATAQSFAALGDEHVNYLHYEAVYVVQLDWTVETWLPLWFGLTYDSSLVVDAPLVGNGVLIKLPDRTAVCVDHHSITSKWAMLRDVLGDGIDRNWLSADEAQTYLTTKLRELVRPDCGLWFSTELTVGSVGE